MCLCALVLNWGGKDLKFEHRGDGLWMFDWLPGSSRFFEPIQFQESKPKKTFDQKSPPNIRVPDMFQPSSPFLAPQVGHSLGMAGGIRSEMAAFNVLIKAAAAARLPEAAEDWFFEARREGPRDKDNLALNETIETI